MTLTKSCYPHCHTLRSLLLQFQVTSILFLPVFAYLQGTAPTTGTSFFNTVTTELEQDDCYVIHMRSSDCTNVASAMKALISGFVDKNLDHGMFSQLVPTFVAELRCGILSQAGNYIIGNT